MAQARDWSFERMASSTSASRVLGSLEVIRAVSVSEGRGDQRRKSPPRLTRSYATWKAPRMRQAKVLRGLARRAMLRQALAESQAWTPIESPWTLPSGLL